MSSGEIALLIKQLAVDAVNAEKPTDLLFGRVVSENPLKIQTDQKIILNEECLVLSGSVMERTIDVSVSTGTNIEGGFDISHSHSYSGETEIEQIQPDLPAHSHSYNGSTSVWGFVIPAHKHIIEGRKKVILHLGLKNGEKVILLRLKGGQQFLVLDRVENGLTEGEWLSDNT